MAKKKAPKITLEGFDDLDLKKEPDIAAAQSVIAKKEKTVSSSQETSKEAQKPSVPKKNTPKKKAATAKPPAEKTSKKTDVGATTKTQNPKGTFPPPHKKRASFNIEADLHRALKAYSFFNEIEMVEYVFEQLVKPDLTKKGYYPPKKRK